MGAAREGHNLWSKWGRQHVKAYIKRNRTLRGIYWGDTFGPMLCGVRGHRPYVSDRQGDWVEYACKCCHQFLPSGAPPPQANDTPGVPVKPTS